MEHLISTFAGLYTNKNTDKSSKLLEFWRFCNVAVAILVLISLLASTISYETNYENGRRNNDCFEQYSSMLLFQWVTFLASIGGIIFVVLGNYTKSLWEEYLVAVDSRFQPFRVKRKYLKLAFEVLLLAIMPYSGLDFHLSEYYGVNEGFLEVCYGISEVLYSLMWLRFYFILKVFLSHPNYVNRVNERITTQCKVKPGLVFTFKSLFKTQPMVMIIFFIGVPSIIVVGMAFRVFERPWIFISNQDWTNPITAVWFSYSTMMLGIYGNYYPLSTYGRIINVVAYLIGTLFFTLIFVNMENQTYLTRKQRKAFYDISLMNQAADVIKSFVKYCGQVKAHDFNSQYTFNMTLNKLDNFRNKRRKLVSLFRQTELDYIELMFEMRQTKNLMEKIYEKTEKLAKLLKSKQ